MLAADDAEITGWALAAKAGDRAAAATFVRLTQPTVIRFLTHLADAADIEDLAQETYLRAMHALPRFAGRSSARTWLLAIARRVAADHVRTLVRRPRLTRGADWESAVEASAAGSLLEDAVVLRQLLLDLPTERREAFVATQIAGLSYAEAAEVCGCPIGTIRSRVARAREDLVAALDGRAAGGRVRSAG
ncbi:MAG TPA: sigma-70 family RNA polymerase sigma factor [Micromonosporaceae bacterium]